MRKMDTKEEKIYTIPLRKAFRKSRNKRPRYAMQLVNEFLRRTLKAESIKIGQHLNSAIWQGRIPRRIRVGVVKQDDIVKAELVGHKYEEFKAEQYEKKGRRERLLERIGGKALRKKAEEELIEKGEKPTEEAIKKKEEELIKKEEERLEKKEKEIKPEKKESGNSLPS